LITSRIARLMFAGFSAAERINVATTPVATLIPPGQKLAARREGRPVVDDTATTDVRCRGDVAGDQR
jgi:hypothetical protein